MTGPQRSDHLLVYGLVGVAMQLVVGVLIVASYRVLPTAWMVVLGGLWFAGSVLAAARWKRTVWIPLLSSVGLSILWMIGFFVSR
jgi:hypothetical protein